MKIISLKAENVKRLKAVEIHPDGSMVVIGGRNAQGKTSVLDAITMALGGASGFCERPLRDGAEHGEVVVDLGDLVVRRTFSADGGTKLVVKGKDGNTKTSPQTLLDALAGRMSFDPLAFSRMDGKKQLETLKGLVGLDFTDLDNRHLTLFEERTICGRDGQAVKARLEAMPHHPDVPAQEVSVLDLTTKLEQAHASNRKRTELLAEFKYADTNSKKLRWDANETRDGRIKTKEMKEAFTALYGCVNRIKSYNQEIDLLERQLSALRASRQVEQDKQPSLEARYNHVKIEAADAADAATKAMEDRATAAASALVGLNEIDILPIQEAIKNVETVNRKVRENLNHRDQLATIEKARKRWDEFTDALAVIDGEKKKQMAEAKFPIAGLSFDASGVLFNGVPFRQSSSAEQLKVSVAMGLALNPELRVVLIRDGSLLDDESLRMVAEMAAANKAQVWIEVVGKGEEVSVVIEDGMVSEVKESVLA